MHNSPFFGREYSGAMKGIAIILMFTLHLLQSGWIKDPSLIVDLRFHGNAFSSIIAYSCDVCIGIFAFITGYGWADSFDKKRKFERILNLYISYWVVLLVFDFPIRILSTEINEGVFPEVSIGEILLSILAIKSSSSLFQWYVFFFGTAVIAFPFFWERVQAANKPIVCLINLGFAAIIPRIALNLIPGYSNCPSVLRDSVSHFINWMPVILIGSLCNSFKIFDRINNILMEKFGHATKIVGSYLFFIGFLIGKGLFQNITGKYVNVDPLFIVPFMFSLIVIVKSIENIWGYMALSKLGGYHYTFG